MIADELSINLGTSCPFWALTHMWIGSWQGLFAESSTAKLVEIGWLTGTYAMVWGVSQLWTGHLGDRVGRRAPVIVGFFLLAAGIAITAAGRDVSLWLPGAIVMGLGMALLYPNLIAAMSDQAAPLIRGKALGTYRYWRDTGYVLGAVALRLIAQFAHATLPALWISAVLVAASGGWLMRDLPRAAE
ncbi:major facilitator superfamily MFS_1 [Acidiphilium sp. JA12-A1]|nr:major facilitator superfamily MFS_1 [Acidiphilium sp. JA12-A1]